MNAARALLQLGKASEAVTPALIEALRDDSNEIFVDAFTATVREVVALALGRATAGTDVGVPRAGGPGVRPNGSDPAGRHPAFRTSAPPPTPPFR